MKNSPYLDKPLRPLAEVEALRSSTEDHLAEEGVRVERSDLQRAFAILHDDRIVVNLGEARIHLRWATGTDAEKNAAQIIADEFTAIRREAYSQPTDLEHELTAALRDVLSAWEAKSGMGTIYEMQRAIPDARRVLAKATERGL